MIKKHSIAIDIGGTNTKLALIAEDGQIIFFESFLTQTTSKSFEDFSKLLISKLENIKTKYHDYSLLGIGVGAPNIDYRTGHIDYAHNLGWRNVSIKKLIESVFELPCYFDNDANLAALGEAHYGVAKNCDDFIAMTLGTGVGTGIMSGGKILHGHSGHAGEGGHIIVRSPGRICACGGEGHLEAYLGAKGIEQTIEEFMQKKIALKEFHTLQSADDEKAQKVLQYCATILADGISTMVAVLSPKLIVLTGGVSQLGEKFRQAIFDQFNLRAFSSYKNSIEIKLSTLNPEHGAILGAHALVLINKSIREIA